MKIIECPECGHKNIAKLQACKKCGARLDKAARSSAYKTEVGHQSGKTPVDELFDATPEQAGFVQCKGCHLYFSQEANECPHCGAAAAHHKKDGLVHTWVVVVVAIALVVAYLGGSRKPEEHRSTLAEQSGLTSTEPATVCHWLDSVGLWTAGWKNMFGEHYYCQSKDKMIGTSVMGAIQNNLVYSVEGDSTRVHRVKLILDIDARQGRSSEALAISELERAIKLLAQKATGQGLYPEILKAVRARRNWSQQMGQAHVRVFRDNWPTGKGYSVKVVIE